MATERRGGKSTYPQLPRRLTTIPTFPDTSTWPVVFPELPPRTNGKFARPPQHTSKAVAPEIPADQVPNHVAVVMDGNGRWATQRGLQPHRGAQDGRGGAHRHHLRCNRNRHQAPDGVCVLHRELEAQRRGGPLPDGLQPGGGPPAPREPGRHGRADALGRFAAPHVAQRHQGVRHRRADDGRQRRHHHQLLRELRRPHRDRRSGTRARPAGGATGKINPGRITEAAFAKHLHRSDIPDVDLFIRTSGEQRASNFLLWQAAYAEYVFQDKLWPDYDRRDLWEACEEYVNRNRRFGRA